VIVAIIIASFIVGLGIWIPFLKGKVSVFFFEKAFHGLKCEGIMTNKVKGSIDSLTKKLEQQNKILSRKP